MANLYGPRIVTDGLVFHVDANNRKCYTGSGNVIDLARGISGTKGSSVSFIDTDAGKSFNFTANSTTNNFITFTGATSTYYEFAAQTVCTWIRTTTTKTNMDFVTGTNGSDTSDRWRHQTTNTQGTNKGIELDWIDEQSWGYFSYATINYDDGEWHYFVTQFDDSTNTGKLYWDNMYYAPTANDTTQDWTTGHGINRINLGGDAFETGSNFIGQMPIVQIYNRVLSANEVQQNYNALKGRFGL